MRTIPRKRTKQSTLAEVGDTVTEVLSEAWSSGAHLAKELASTAADRAGDLGSVAAEQVSDASEKVADVVGKARDKARPVEKRRWNPWLMVALAIVAFAGTAWWLRRRHQEQADLSVDEPTSVSDYRAAAGS